MSAHCPDCGGSPFTTVAELLEHYDENHPGQSTYRRPAIEEFRRGLEVWAMRDDVQAVETLVRYLWARLPPMRLTPLSLESQGRSPTHEFVFASCRHGDCDECPANFVKGARCACPHHELEPAPLAPARTR